MKPVSFMRLRHVKNLDDVLRKFDSNTLIIEQKIDGWKCFVSKQSGETNLYSRRGKERGDNVVDLINEIDDFLPDDTAILGEVTVVKSDGRQSIHDVQFVMGSKPVHSAEKIFEIEEEGGKIVFFAYDILELKSRRLSGLPFEERKRILYDVVAESDVVKTLRSYSWVERSDALRDASSVGSEGVVIKPKDSKYIYAKLGLSEPFGQQVKYKLPERVQTEDVILQTHEIDDLNGQQKVVFPMFQFKAGKLIEVGNLSGLDMEVETNVLSLLSKGKWVVVEVTYQEKSSAGKLSHVGYVRGRADKPVKSVTVESESLLEQTERIDVFKGHIPAVMLVERTKSGMVR